MRLSRFVAMLFTLAFFVLPFTASAQQRLAFYDRSRLMEELEEAKAAKARLHKWTDDRQKELDREQEALRKEKEVLDRQASSLKPDVLQQKQSDLQGRVAILMTKYERMQREAQNRERLEMEPVLSRINQVVARLAEQKGFAMIFDRRTSGLTYGQTQYDLTNEIIRMYNAAFNAAPKPPAK